MDMHFKPDKFRTTFYHTCYLSPRVRSVSRSGLYAHFYFTALFFIAEKSSKTCPPGLDSAKQAGKLDGNLPTAGR